MKIAFCTTRQVKLPTRGTEGSAGLDLYVPAFTKEFLLSLCQANNSIPRMRKAIDPLLNIAAEDIDALLVAARKLHILDKENSVIVRKHESFKIPGGLMSNFEPGWSLLLLNKSGVATKQTLLRTACLIDSDYTGEIVYCLYNFGNKDTTFEFGQKIIQGVILPVPETVIEEISLEEFTKRDPKTRKGGFGSTGKK